MPLHALFALLGLALASPGLGPLTVQQMSEDLAQLERAARTAWAYHEDRAAHSGLVLDELRVRCEAMLGEVRSREDFARVLRHFVASLQDGHADVAMPGLRLPARRWPLRLADCAEGVLVISVSGARSDPADRSPAPGDLLIAVDGKPIEDLLAERAATVFASTPEARRHWTVMLLRLTDDKDAVFTLRPPDGRVYEARLATLDRSSAPAPEPRPANWSLTWPADGIACLRVSTFAVADWEGWLKAPVWKRGSYLRDTYRLIEQRIDEINERGARGLILDLRGNEGGTDALGTHLARHLLAEPFVYMRLSSKYFGRWSEPGGMTVRPAERQFTGPVVALIDPGCFSTTDNFLRCLDDLHPDFTAVGRPTGGGTGAPREVVTLRHSGAAVTLCTMRVYGPASGLIEGRGTRPNVPVTWTREDYVSGHDPDLHAAVGVLKSKPWSP